MRKTKPLHRPRCIHEGVAPLVVVQRCIGEFSDPHTIEDDNNNVSCFHPYIGSGLFLRTIPRVFATSERDQRFGIVPDS